MRFLAWVRHPKPARQPARQPGRHSAEWAAMVQGLAELQARAREFEQRCEALRAGRDAVLDGAEELKQRLRQDAQDWQAALDFASEQFAELERLYDERGREVESLRALLRPCDDGDPGISLAAAKDRPDWAPLPDAARAPDSRRAEPFPSEPVSNEAADVDAETLAVDVRGLRVAATVTVPAGWTVTALPAQPPLPDLAPTLAMPLAEALAAPVEASPVIGQRAHDSVAEAVGAAP